MTLVGAKALDLVDEVVELDTVVVGTGVSGLTAALGLSPRRVALITKAHLESGASTWAQGGIAVALGGDDSPALHAADTLAASAGLADPEIVALLTDDGPPHVSRLIEIGARFDRSADGALQRGREGAHSRRRILHAGGDATGAEMVRALGVAVRRAPGIELVEGVFAEDLALDGGRVAGVVARQSDGRRVLYLAPAVVIATGGLGQLYLHTTNPSEVTGDGHAMAARAGARLVDMEFVQFHPTALGVAALSGRDAGDERASDPQRRDPAPLLTEALRGEGAILVDSAGQRFMVAEHPLAELAPRDVVARAIWRRQVAGQVVYLDARDAIGQRFPARFPTVFAACRRYGLDPRRDLLPVTPAAHFHMGGIAVDASGQSSLAGLWACGEASSTGAHGANRLASNSLLEALVFGARVAEDIRAAAPCRLPRAESAVVPGAETGSDRRLTPDPPTPSPQRGKGEQRDGRGRGRDGSPSRNGTEAARDGVAITRDGVPIIRRLMWEKVGLVREGEGLAAALATLEDLLVVEPPLSGEARNLATVGRLVAAAALARTESRGAHYRTDFPTPDPRWQRRIFLTLRRGTSRRAVDIELSEPVPATSLPAREVT